MTSVQEKSEAALVAAAIELQSMCQLLRRNGVRRDRARLLELHVELVEVSRLAAAVCSGEPVSDEHITEVTERMRQAAADLFAELDTGQGKCFLV